jgi:molybdate transport system substrate-binding protein
LLALATVLAPLLAFVLALGACTPAGSPVEVVVVAAASTEAALEELRPPCEREAGARVTLAFGATNDLARQILAANRADVFLAADEEWMDALTAAGLVDAASRRPLLGNGLAVIGRPELRGRIGDAGELATAGVRRLALADPDAVPAGRYARAWLEREGVWEAVSARIVPVLDAPAAVAAVESGAAEVGVVYRTDAALARRAALLFTVPEERAPAIRYPIAVLGARPHAEAARRVVECLAGARAAAVFASYGFTPLAGAPAA